MALTHIREGLHGIVSNSGCVPLDCIVLVGFLNTRTFFFASRHISLLVQVEGLASDQQDDMWHKDAQLAMLSANGKPVRHLLRDVWRCDEDILLTEDSILDCFEAGHLDPYLSLCVRGIISLLVASSVILPGLHECSSSPRQDGHA